MSKHLISICVGLGVGVLATLAFQYLHLGTQYPDIRMLCKGDIYSHLNGMSSHPSDLTLENQIIGMNIQKDSIELTGNNFQSLNSLNVCKLGETELAKKDELFFDTDGCGTTESTEKKSFGTFNYITKKLTFTHEFSLTDRNIGQYLCQDLAK